MNRTKYSPVPLPIHRKTWALHKHQRTSSALMLFCLCENNPRVFWRFIWRLVFATIRSSSCHTHPFPDAYYALDSLYSLLFTKLFKKKIKKAFMLMHLGSPHPLFLINLVLYPAALQLLSCICAPCSSPLSMIDRGQKSQRHSRRTASILRSQPLLLFRLNIQVE